MAYLCIVIKDNFFLLGRLYAHTSPHLAVTHLAGETLMVAVPVKETWFLERKNQVNNTYDLNQLSISSGLELPPKRSRRDGKTFQRRVYFREVFSKKNNHNQQMWQTPNRGKEKVYSSFMLNSNPRDDSLVNEIVLKSNAESFQKILPYLPTNKTLPSGILTKNNFSFLLRGINNKTQKSDEKNDEKYSTKSFQNYSKTFVSDMSEHGQSKFFAPPSKHTKKTLLFKNHLEKTKLNLEDNKNLNPLEDTNSKIAETKFYKKIREAKRSFWQGRENLQEKTWLRENKETKFSLLFKPLFQDAENNSSFISIWCKYRNKSLSESLDKEFRPLQTKNFSKYFLHNLVMNHLLLDLYCKKDNSHQMQKDELLIARNNASHVQNKPQNYFSNSKFQKQNRHKQIFQKNMHRKLGLKRCRSCLKEPDNISVGENKVGKERALTERKLRKEQEQKGEIQVSKVDRRNIKKKKKPKLNQLENIHSYSVKHGKIYDCNKIKNSSKDIHQTYCPFGNFLIQKNPETLTIKRKKINKKTTLKRVSKRRRKNKKQIKFYSKRGEKNKNKIYTGLAGVPHTQISEADCAFYSGRFRKRCKKGKREEPLKSLIKFSIQPTNKIKGIPSYIPRWPSFVQKNAVGQPVNISHRNPKFSLDLNKTGQGLATRKKIKEEISEKANYSVILGSKFSENFAVAIQRYERFIKPFGEVITQKPVSVVRFRRWVEEKEAKKEKKNIKKEANKNENLKLSSNITFRCSPSKKFWLFATR